MDRLQKISVLEKLGLSHSEAVVYVTMAGGCLQVGDIMRETAMKRPSVYYAISKLEARGLIGRIKVGEYNQWQLTEPNQIVELLHDQQTSLDVLKSEAASLIQDIKDQESTGDVPKVTYFRGQKAIESVVFNSLYCKNKEILSIAPDGNFFQQTGIDFATKYVAERKKRGIKTKHLWESVLDPNVMSEYYGEQAEIRFMPELLKGKFKTTVFIYDDTVMYIAPKESDNTVVFRSKEHVGMLRAIFETIWSVSTPLK